MPQRRNQFLFRRSFLVRLHGWNGLRHLIYPSTLSAGQRVHRGFPGSYILRRGAVWLITALLRKRSSLSSETICYSNSETSRLHLKSLLAEKAGAAGLNGPQRRAGDVT